MAFTNSMVQAQERNRLQQQMNRSGNPVAAQEKRDLASQQATKYVVGIYQSQTPTTIVDANGRRTVVNQNDVMRQQADYFTGRTQSPPNPRTYGNWENQVQQQEQERQNNSLSRNVPEWKPSLLDFAMTKTPSIQPKSWNVLPGHYGEDLSTGYSGYGIPQPTMQEMADYQKALNISKQLRGSDKNEVFKKLQEGKDMVFHYPTVNMDFVNRGVSGGGGFDQRGILLDGIKFNPGYFAYDRISPVEKFWVREVPPRVATHISESAIKPLFSGIKKVVKNSYDPKSYGYVKGADEMGIYVKPDVGFNRHAQEFVKDPDVQLATFTILAPLGSAFFPMIEAGLVGYGVFQTKQAYDIYKKNPSVETGTDVLLSGGLTAVGAVDMGVRYNPIKFKGETFKIGSRKIKAYGVETLGNYGKSKGYNLFNIEEGKIKLGTPEVSVKNVPEFAPEGSLATTTLLENLPKKRNYLQTLNEFKDPLGDLPNEIAQANKAQLSGNKQREFKLVLQQERSTYNVKSKFVIDKISRDIKTLHPDQVSKVLDFGKEENALFYGHFGARQQMAPKMDLLPEQYALQLHGQGKLNFVPRADIGKLGFMGVQYTDVETGKPSIAIDKNIKIGSEDYSTTLSHELIHFKQPNWFKEAGHVLPYDYQPHEILAYAGESPTKTFKAKVPVTRITSDIDLFADIPKAEAKIKINKLVAELNKVEGGSKVRLSAGSPTLIESQDIKGNWHHAVDIHLAEGADSYGVPEQKLGFKVGNKKAVVIEGANFMPLSEQGLRKAGSVFTLRDNNLMPAPHRVKDIGDYFVTQQALSASKILGKKQAGLRLQSIKKFFPKEYVKDGDIFVRLEGATKGTQGEQFLKMSGFDIHARKGNTKDETYNVVNDLSQSAKKNYLNNYYEISKGDSPSPSIVKASPSVVIVSPSPSRNVIPSRSPSVFKKENSPSLTIFPPKSPSPAPRLVSSPSPSITRSPPIISPPPKSPSPSPQIIINLKTLEKTKPLISPKISASSFGSSGSGGFFVILREKGREVRGNLNSMTRMQAELFGRDVTKQSLAASFKVVRGNPSNLPVSQRIKWASGAWVNPFNFKPGKSAKTKGFNVELPKYRIGGQGAKVELKQARRGWLA
jgi:hypothetical protein